MKYLFLASLTGGLLQGVRVMLLGVERPRGFADSDGPTYRLSPAVVTVAAAVFGLSGYLVLLAGAGPIESFVAAIAFAAVASATTVRVMKGWWAKPVEHDVDDPRYVLQGHVARVVSAIERDREGEISFEVGGDRRVVRARGVDQTPLPAGTEVVIERLENDVAFVEAWAQVEKRL